MNIKSKFYAIAVCCFIALSFTSCKSKKTVATNNEVGQVLQELPCEKDGFTDKKTFRSFAMATSSDLSLARDKALLSAKQRLVTLIESNTKSVTDRYVNEREVTNASEFEGKFENLTREVANQTIENISVACQKSSVLDNGKYRSFVAIEVDKEDLMNNINDKISNNSKLQIDYDKQKFEEIYNQEMEKLSEERGY